MAARSEADLDAPVNPQGPGTAALRSLGFELLGFAAILLTVALTVGLRIGPASKARASGATPVMPRTDPAPAAGPVDTDTSRHPHNPSTHATTQGGDVRLSQDSLAKRRDAAAQEPTAHADSTKTRGAASRRSKSPPPAAPPPSAVVP
jgi:hypothetical protein